MDERRVRWLCRRGMKELDVMLERYMDVRWPQAGEVEREAFAWLLELQDPALWELLSGRGAKAPLPREALEAAGRGAKAPLPREALEAAGRGAKAPLPREALEAAGRGAKAPLQKDLEDVVERIRTVPDA